MSVIEAPSSVTEIVEAARRLSDQDLEQLVLQLMSLRSQRRGQVLAPRESELLERINRGLPEDIAGPYSRLIEKRDAANLTEEEHRELIRLSDIIEGLDVERYQAMADLADVRGISMKELRKQLGIPRPDDAEA